MKCTRQTLRHSGNFTVSGSEERRKEGEGNGERDIKRGTTFYKTKKAVGFDNGLRHLHRRVKRSGTDIRKSACINGF